MRVVGGIYFNVAVSTPPVDYSIKLKLRFCAEHLDISERRSTNSPEEEGVATNMCLFRTLRDLGPTYRRRMCNLQGETGCAREGDEEIRQTFVQVT